MQKVVFIFHLSRKNGRFSMGINSFFTYSWVLNECESQRIFEQNFHQGVFYFSFNKITHNQENRNLHYKTNACKYCVITYMSTERDYVIWYSTQ